MILTNWAHVLVALFHCSLPPYVLPESIKWLLKENKHNSGFTLAQTPLLKTAAYAIATDPTTTPNPNSSWDHTIHHAFLKISRPYLGKISENAPDCARHTIEAHNATIEQ